MNEEKELKIEENNEYTNGVKTTVLEKMTETDELSTIPQKEEEVEEKEPSALREVFEVLRDAAISLVVILFIINFIVRPIQVNGSSMYPTLENGEIGISNLIGRRIKGIKRFDIVIIYLEDKDEYLVKRCVGLPNETVSYKDGKLYINGAEIAEDFLDEEYKSEYGGAFMGDVEEITLGEDEYYCLGDNRPKSTDSRYYGPFKEDMIISKGALIIMPFGNFGVKSW